MTPTELYTHISEAEGIPMQELNPLQHELMQIAAEALALRDARETTETGIPEDIADVTEGVAELRRIQAEALPYRQQADEIFKMSQDSANACTTDYEKALVQATIGYITHRSLATDRALDSAQDIDKRNEKDFAYATIVATLLSNGEMDRAAKLVEFIVEEYYKSIAQIYIAAHTHDLALVGRALEPLEELDDELMGAQAIVNIASYIVQAGDPRLAVTLVNSLANEHDKSEALANITSAIAQSGNIAWAIELKNQISSTEPYLRDKALLGIIPHMARSGDIARARNEAGEIHDLYLRARALISIAEVTNDDTIIDQVRSLLPRIIINVEKAETLIRLAAIRYEPELIEMALRYASDIANPRGEARVYANIVKVLDDRADEIVSGATVSTK
ncbi:hypothetical protein KBC99_00125 [Candidatus Saccharibacteria bacterium]|nr:hypothetical protein [Candidatus Saccharibacteria bacterium]